MTVSSLLLPYLAQFSTPEYHNRDIDEQSTRSVRMPSPRVVILLSKRWIVKSFLALMTVGSTCHSFLKYSSWSFRGSVFASSSNPSTITFRIDACLSACGAEIDL